ncbi:MAG: sulfotransferase [Gammaproteobacteria bacterium]|nr:sulfotransferase [Gammaproteobacteria bacterium]
MNPEQRARIEAAMGLAEQGEAGAAVRACRSLLAQDPQLVPALCLLGRLCRQAGDLAEARGLLERARALAGPVPVVLRELGLLSFLDGHTGEAIASFRELTRRRPDDADAWFNLAHALELEQRAGDAVGAWRQALELAGGGSELRNRLAGAQARAGDAMAARAGFEAVLAEEPDNPESLYGLASVLVTLGEFDAAVALYRRCLAIEPQRVQAWQQLVHAQRYRSEQDEDIGALQARLEAASSDRERETLAFALGKALDDCGAVDRAFACFELANRLQAARYPAYDAEYYARQAQAVQAAFAARLPAMPAPAAAAPRPIFVFGMPRSGTTLVEQILSSHSAVAGGGELHFFAHRRELEPFPAALALLDGEARQELARRYRELLAELGDGAAQVTDKFPGNFLYLGLLDSMFPDAAFVHCHRDPRDTGLSIFFQDFGASQPYARDLDHIAGHYRLYQGLMTHFRGLLGDRILDVEYEQVVADTETQTRRLLSHCGLDFEPGCLEFSRSNPRAVNTLSNWQVRQPVYRRSLARWQRYEQHLDALAALVAEP